MTRNIKRNQAFTLVEITIVVGIILLIAAISIHSLLRARINSNDGAALTNAKAIATALEAYRISQSPPEYTNEITDLVGGQPPYLSEAFRDRAHQGYNFYIVGANENAYIIYAQPVHYGLTGTKFIICDQSGIAKYDEYEMATVVLNSMPPRLGLTGIEIPDPPPGYTVE